MCLWSTRLDSLKGQRIFKWIQVKSRIIFPLFPVDYFFSHEIEMYFVLKMEHNLFLIIRSPPSFINWSVILNKQLHLSNWANIHQLINLNKHFFPHKIWKIFGSCIRSFPQQFEKKPQQLYYVPGTRILYAIKIKHVENSPIKF